VKSEMEKKMRKKSKQRLRGVKIFKELPGKKNSFCVNCFTRILFPSYSLSGED
jgi:hypothetical protein